MPQGYSGLSKKSRQKRNEADATWTVQGITSIQGGKYGRFHVVPSGSHPLNLNSLDRYYELCQKKFATYYRVKRVVALLGAGACICFLAPLILIIVLWCWACGQSPLFLHRRVGKGGVIFNCLKFQTMVPNADQVLQTLLDSDRKIKEEWLKDHKLRNDPRITTIGRFLRRTSLDELPQLWNVIRGEMSLVGPRPVVPDELARYGHKAGIFLSATPGITGLWQVSGRNDTDYRKRVALDVCYVRARRLSLDFLILLRTLPAVFAKNGAY